MTKTNPTDSRKKVTNVVLNVSILALIIVCGYLIFSIAIKTFSSNDRNPVQITDTTDKVTNQPNLTMQLDVRNGTGEDGIAKMFTDYLREKGFDVVEMGNYNTDDQEKSLVLDRKGNKQNCKKIAQALGVSDKNVIQQINKDLLIDATVVIGKDYKELSPYLKKKPTE
jgi:hypothetical protein